MLVIAPPFAVGTAAVWVVEQLARGIKSTHRAPAAAPPTVEQDAAHPLTPLRSLSVSSIRGYGAVA
jgi:hypothetical protein